MNQIDLALLILTLGSGLATGLIILLGERQRRNLRRTVSDSNREPLHPDPHC